jgi:hypothetical protein
MPTAYRSWADTCISQWWILLACRPSLHHGAAAINSCAISFDDLIRFALHRADGWLWLLVGFSGGWYKCNFVSLLNCCPVSCMIMLYSPVRCQWNLLDKIYTNIKPFPGEIISVFSSLVQIWVGSVVSHWSLANDVQPLGRGRSCTIVIFWIKFRQILNHSWEKSLACSLT